MDSMFFFGLEGVTASWVPFLWGWSKHVLADVHKKNLDLIQKTTKLLNESLTIHFAKRLLVFFCWPLKKSISCKMSHFYTPQMAPMPILLVYPPCSKKTVESAKSKESSKEEPPWNCGWFRNPAKQLRLLPCDIGLAIRVARDDAFAY